MTSGRSRATSTHVTSSTTRYTISPSCWARSGIAHTHVFKNLVWLGGWGGRWVKRGGGGDGGSVSCFGLGCGRGAQCLRAVVMLMDYLVYRCSVRHFGGGGRATAHHTHHIYVCTCKQVSRAWQKKIRQLALSPRFRCFPRPMYVCIGG